MGVYVPDPDDERGEGKSTFSGGGKSTFSEDVFKIELCGPDRDNLSIIDIPGIFRVPTENITTQEDVLMVKRMVHRWIQHERTVILAVVNANNEIATQEVLSVRRRNVLKLQAL